MEKQTNIANKWTGYGLLYGSILLSFICYIIVMAVGFKVPGTFSAQTYLTPTNLGLWDLKVKDYGNYGIGSDLSDTGVACIVFLVISLCLLIAGFVVHNNTHYKTNKFIKRSTISIFIIFAIALILALAGKVDVHLTDISKSLSLDVSIWVKAVLVIIGETDDYSVKLQYTAQAIPVVILLSLSIVLPTIYTILGLTKIPYKN